MFLWLYGLGVAVVLLAVLAVVARGMARLACLTEPQWDILPQGNPRVSIIVPARNEAEDIAACLASLAAQDYANLEVIAVDDRSTDRTGALMEEAAAAHPGRIRPLHITDLPPGWLGKTHAMSQGVSAATGDWLLFTDGDVIFRPDTLRRALAYGESSGSHHVVMLPTFITHSMGERMLMAMFQLGAIAGRPWKSPDPTSNAAVGVGAFNLVRRSAYEQIGGWAVMRNAVIEDMKIGQVLKQAGFVQHVVLGRDLASLHWAAGAMGMVNNLGKNFYAFAKFRWYLAVLVVLGILAVHVAPFALLFLAPGLSKAPFLLCIAALFGYYLVLYPYFGLNPAYILLHPMAAILVCYSLLRSMALAVSQGGIVWRGTKYPLTDLQ